MGQREMVLYARSLRCWRARRFLGRPGNRFEIVDTTDDPGVLVGLSKAAWREEAPPYVAVDHRPVSGLVTMKALVGSGQFEHLLWDDL